MQSYTQPIQQQPHILLYSPLFQSVVVCMFPDIGSLLYEYKMQWPHAIQMNLLSSHDKDFTAKYFRHEIYAGDSDACGSKDC